MNQKKELLIQILNKLKPHRDLADGILALIESSYADEKAIDGVIHVIANSIKTLKNSEQKTILQKGLEKIQQIKSMEEDEEISEEELDAILADI
jgi:peptide subunit release factor 1 (eRF1)